MKETKISPSEALLGAVAPMLALVSAGYRNPFHHPHPDVVALCAIHRVGALDVGDIAVVVGASAPHRAEAFAACRAFIDTLKEQVPIWKREEFADGDHEWVGC